MNQQELPWIRDSPFSDNKTCNYKLKAETPASTLNRRRYDQAASQRAKATFQGIRFTTLEGATANSIQLVMTPVILKVT